MITESVTPAALQVLTWGTLSRRVDASARFYPRMALEEPRTTKRRSDLQSPKKKTTQNYSTYPHDGHAKVFLEDLLIRLPFSGEGQLGTAASMYGSLFSKCTQEALA